MDPRVRTANALALVIRCSCIASDFVVLVLSEAVLSATVLVLDDLFELGRYRSLIEAVRGNLRTNRPDRYSARSSVFDLCKVPSPHSVNASRWVSELA